MGPSSYDRGGASQLETKRALLTTDEVMNMRENELRMKMPQRPAARLTQRRYDDPEVRGRAPARGESWIPPLGPERAAGRWRVRRALGGARGEGTVAEGTAPEEPDPYADDPLFARALPDRSYKAAQMRGRFSISIAYAVLGYAMCDTTVRDTALAGQPPRPAIAPFGPRRGSLCSRGCIAPWSPYRDR